MTAILRGTYFDVTAGTGWDSEGLAAARFTRNDVRRLDLGDAAVVMRVWASAARYAAASASIISRTASVMPISTARAMMWWPIDISPKR